MISQSNLNKFEQNRTDFISILNTCSHSYIHITKRYTCTKSVIQIECMVNLEAGRRSYKDTMYTEVNVSNIFSI